MEYLEGVNKLNKWNTEYYTLSKPTVADAVYDKWKRFIQNEEEVTGFTHPNSPSLKVGGSLIDKFVKVKHDFPMLSISNGMSLDDIDKFGRRIEKASAKPLYNVEWKIDGIGVALRYENGKLLKAITRGNGGFGEDITHNVKTVSNIPQVIPYQGKIEFRGELHMYQHIFDRQYKGKANSRNVVSGAMKRKHTQTNHGVVGTIYTIPNPLDHGLTTQTAVLEFIKEQGLTSNGQLGLGDIEFVKKLAKECEETRKTCGFDVDGLVIKVNDIDLWDEIGLNNTSPRFFLAYKFPELPVTTTILNILNSVGKNTVTPVAQVKTVWVAGSNISNVTLHNYDYIKTNNINVGDDINIIKSGGVIPKFVSIEKKHSEGFYLPPTECPSCGSNLQIGEKHVICSNKGCKGRILAQMVSAVGVKKLNIHGLGDKKLEMLVNNGIITDMYDLLTLKFENPSKNEVKIMANIEGVLDKNFIAILNIDGVGSTYGKIIEPQITKLTDLLDIPYFTGIGDSANRNIKLFTDRELLVKLDSLKVVEHFEGITGVSLNKSKREAINDKWRAKGGIIVDTGGDLVVGKNITVAEFLDLIK